MAKEDFCYTYYDGDAARDKAHMDRLERGAYDDLISLQRKIGPFSIDHAKKILSKDFDACWPALEMVLKVDEQGKYCIEWLKTSIERARAHSVKQKVKVNSYWEKKRAEKNQNDTTVNTTDILRNNSGINSEEPLEDGDGDGKNKVLLGMEAVTSVARTVWDDQRWRESMCMGHKISMDDLKAWMAQYNASIACDAIQNFSASTYKKIFNGWLNTQKGKGYTVSAGKANTDQTLKKI